MGALKAALQRPRRWAVTALLIGVLVGAGASPAGAGGDRSGRSAAVVVEWNQKVNEIAFAEDQFLTFKGARAHSMMHIAQHDALNAIDLFSSSSPTATVTAGRIRRPPRRRRRVRS